METTTGRGEKNDEKYEDKEKEDGEEGRRMTLAREDRRAGGNLQQEHHPKGNPRTMRG